jgi:hypothetical protein
VFVGALGALAIIAYTVIYALRTWRDGNRQGGLGLLVLTALVTALTAYVLLLRP